MAKRVYAKINKETLSFIRETKKITFDYIEQSTKINRDKVLLWENLDSDKYPTINQAKNLAKCYRVPFAGLYMNSANVNINHLPLIVNKRTVLNRVDNETAINLALIDLLNDRDSYVEAKEMLGESIPTFSFPTPNSLSSGSLAKRIREFFGISIEEQYKKKSNRQFYLYLRGSIESKGIFVQGFQKVDTEILRGVAIVDESMPIIGINNNDRYPAKSFSIIHELVHIIKRSSVICNDMFGLDSLDAEEVFCNAVAGEVLVPRAELLKAVKNVDKLSIDVIDSLAKKFSVSSEVINRRLFDTKIVDRRSFDYVNKELVERFNTDRERTRNEIKMGLKNPPRRNMSMEAFDYNSAYYCETIFKCYQEGLFDKADVSNCIRIGQKHVNKFMLEVMKWQM